MTLKSHLKSVKKGTAKISSRHIFSVKCFFSKFLPPGPEGPMLILILMVIILIWMLRGTFMVLKGGGTVDSLKNVGPLSKVKKKT